MKLTMLGTGNALATRVYNTCFILEDKGELLLVDGGGGNQLLNQIEKAGYRWQDIKQIFVTHKHIDHLLGIVWMMRMILQHMNAKQYEGEAYIYGNEEVIDILLSLASTLLTPKQTRYIGERLHLIKVHDGDHYQWISHEVTVFDIQSTKATQFGFMMHYGPDLRLTCLGDEPYNDCEKVYVDNCDYLLQEAFCLYEHKDIFKPYEKHHSTVKDAASLAENLNVKNIILYHTEDTHILVRKERYTKEATQYYRGKVYVPEDLETIEIK